MAGLKFKNGKFVPRTEAEEQRLKEYFATATKPKRVPRKRDPFVQITLWQLDLLLPALSSEACIFFMLCFESFRHRDAAFVWPVEKLTEIGGFEPHTQRRAALFLQRAGLISVRRRHRKLPTVQILTDRFCPSKPV